MTLALDHPCEACVWDRHDRCVPGGCSCSLRNHRLVIDLPRRSAPVGHIGAKARVRKLASPSEPSSDRKRTERNRRLLAEGTHPATRLALLSDSAPDSTATCGSCAHCYPGGGGNRVHWKCDRVVATNGPGTDLRKMWPACTGYEPRGES